jgi:hypothetical protein
VLRVRRGRGWHVLLHLVVLLLLVLQLFVKS